MYVTLDNLQKIPKRKPPDDVFLVNQGSLHPALQRMKRKGWISAESIVSASHGRG
jgi:DNA-binding PadR family transcriptional regulator